jgi:hypothetical protein
MADDLSRQFTALVARNDIPQDARDVISAVVASSPLQTDRWIYRAVVVVLGLTVLSTVLGGLAIVLFLHQDASLKLPDSLVAIGSAAVGALAGLLAPSPVSRG